MATSNKNITFHGSPLTVEGNGLKKGDTLPDFELVGVDMSTLTKSSFNDKVLVVLSVPSLDTPVCDIEVKRFNEAAGSLSEEVAVLVVSRDLPFAQKRWCGAADADRVVCGSDYKHRSFGASFGTDIPDMGLLARAVFVAGKDSKLLLVDYVPELSAEPDYDSALGAIRAAI